MISIYFILFFALLTSADVNSTYSFVRIYSNLAEIIRPLDRLPIEFTDDEWNLIRPDSITLLGENLNITLQTIKETKNTRNGSQIYINLPIKSDTTTFKLIKATFIDDTTNIVKIQDESFMNGQPLYFSASNDQIFYLNEPAQSKYYVNFTYISPYSDHLHTFVSYLRSGLNWKTQYQLFLLADQSQLITMANIENERSSPVFIHQAELISGDINLQMYQQSHRSFRKARFESAAMPMVQADSLELPIEQGYAVAGLYRFAINNPFKIDAKTNYLLPMFRPRVTVERYSSISKAFSTTLMVGKAQRSYHLRSDRYLSQGNCIIREDERIVGEIFIPNLAANDKYDFSIGEDADVIYKENVKLISYSQFNETELTTKTSTEMSSSPILVLTRSKFIYEINLQIINFKMDSVNVEYEQKSFSSFQSVQLIKSEKHKFVYESSEIKSNMSLKGNTTENYSYTIELIR